MSQNKLDVNKNALNQTVKPIIVTEDGVGTHPAEGNYKRTLLSNHFDVYALLMNVKVSIKKQHNS